MKHSAATIAQYVLLESLRSGLPWLAAACALAAFGLAGFLSQVAITEAAALQASAAAALLRVCAVFLMAAHVVTSIARESNDKGVELALALPLSRHAWYLGKLLGFAGVGVLLATTFALPLLLWATPGSLASWGLSLAGETALVAALALFFASSMAHPVGAIAATIGFYLLARVIPAVQAIAAGPLAAEGTGAGAVRWTIDALALLLPRLDALTRGDWLLYGAPPASDLVPAIAGIAIYLLLLIAAGLFDLNRRNF